MGEEAATRKGNLSLTHVQMMLVSSLINGHGGWNSERECVCFLSGGSSTRNEALI